VLVARIVMPACIVSIVASSSSYSENFSTTDSRMRLRSSASIPDHTPESNVSRAAAIARCASSRPAAGTLAKTSSVAGLITSKVSPEAASTHSPPM
jgi:hypothetical protein